MNYLPQLSRWPARLAGLLALGLASIAPAGAFALGHERIVSFELASPAAPLLADGIAAPLIVDTADWPGVQRAVRDLQADVERVGAVKPVINPAPLSGVRFAVLIGTVGKSPLIDGLVKAGKLDVSAISGRWEAF